VKHSSLLQKLVNYGRKKFHNIGPWFEVKFITGYSNAIHSIITTTQLKQNYLQQKEKSTKQARLGFVIDSILIKREA
jgi:hypothetical protein